MFVLVSWGVQSAFLPQAGETLEPSMEDGDIQAKQIEGSQD